MDSDVGTFARAATADSARLGRRAAAFRLTARFEAVSWTGLLVGMLFKYVVSHSELGVHIFGPIHGVAFLCYVGSTLLAARAFGWTRGLLVVGLVASILPLATWPFERFVSRRGARTED